MKTEDSERFSKEVAGMLLGLAKDGFIAADMSVIFNFSGAEDADRFRKTVKGSGLPLKISEDTEILKLFNNMIVVEPVKEPEDMSEVSSFFVNCGALSKAAEYVGYTFNVAKNNGNIYIVNDSEKFAKKVKEKPYLGVCITTVYVMTFDDFVSIFQNMQ